MKNNIFGQLDEEPDPVVAAWPVKGYVSVYGKGEDRYTLDVLFAVIRQSGRVDTVSEALDGFFDIDELKDHFVGVYRPEEID